jgi:restriction system protein
MAIPDFQTIMLPLLKFFQDKQEHLMRDAVNYIANLFNLTDIERNELLPSGQESVINNRVHWSRTYLKKAGLLESPRRGYAKITDRGIKELEKNLVTIDKKYLEQFPEFIEFQTIKKKQNNEIIGVKEPEKPTGEQTPDELIEKGYNLIVSVLSQELLNKLRSEHFSVLEKVVLRLLTNMDYGEGKVTGRTGDGGVDGFIDQDKLGLDKIYFQAKRFDENNPVSASMLRDFIGSLDLKGVKKGVFITTSKFPKDAEELIKKTSKSIILIDGDKLAKLMIEYDIGVATERKYLIKSIDNDFFEELSL